MMEIKAPKDCTQMDDVRAAIDHLDSEMVNLLAQRWQYVDRAWQLKNDPAEATVPWRIQQVIDRVKNQAEEQNLPPALAEALWRQIISWAIQFEEEKLHR